jgi:hypothetical protein
MNRPNRFSCPSCGSTVYNRRNSRCEFCDALIPVELAYSTEQLAVIDADHARNEWVRARLAREAEEREQARIKRRET